MRRSFHAPDATPAPCTPIFHIVPPYHHFHPLKELAGETPVSAAVHAQLHARSARVTKNNKPYLELVFADSSGNFQLKIWSDSPICEWCIVARIGLEINRRPGEPGLAK